MKAAWWVSPAEANLLLTGKCNLACRHCSVSSHGNLYDDLPMTAWVDILEKLQKSKVIRLTLTGGEPLLRDDFVRFVAEIGRRPFRFTVNTNGTLVTSRIIDAVAGCGSRFEGFMVSLDGPDRRTVDSQRGAGVYVRTVRGMEELNAAGIPFGCYCTVTSLNAQLLCETAEVALGLGADWIKFNNFILAGPELEEGIIPENSTIIKAAEKLRVLLGRYPGRITGSIMDMRRRVDKLHQGMLPRTNGASYSCGGGIKRIAVFPDGTVTPCDHLPDFSLGNLTEGSLEEILKGDRMAEFREFLDRPRKGCSSCVNCEYLHLCTGGCPVEALSGCRSICFDRHSCLKLALEKT